MSKNENIPNKSIKIEFYVGLFFIVGLCCLAYLTFNLAGMRFGNVGYYNIVAEFDSVSGLEREPRLKLLECQLAMLILLT